MERLSPSKKRREESYLIKSKQLINDMAEQLAKLSHNNEILQSKLKQSKKQNQDILLKNKTLQEELFLIKQNSKIKEQEYDSQMSKVAKQIQSKHQELKQKQQKYQKQIQKIKYQSQKQINKLKQIINKAQNELTLIKNVNKQQKNHLNQMIKKLQLAANENTMIIRQEQKRYGNKMMQLQKQIMINKHIIGGLEKQKKQLEIKLVKRQKQYQSQLQQLRSINIKLKNHFEEIQRGYLDIINYQDNQNTVIQTKHIRKRRSQTSRIQKIVKKDEPKHHEIGKLTYAKSRMNPQMHDELRNIKRQIDNQYLKLQTNRDRCIKQRVDKTLATIENILSQMSQRVDISDSQNGF